MRESWSTQPTFRKRCAFNQVLRSQFTAGEHMRQITGEGHVSYEGCIEGQVLIIRTADFRKADW